MKSPSFCVDPVNSSLAEALGHKEGPLRYLSLSENLKQLVVYSCTSQPVPIYSLPSTRLSANWFSKTPQISFYKAFLLCTENVVKLCVIVKHDTQFSLWYPESDTVQNIPIVIPEEIHDILLVSFCWKNITGEQVHSSMLLISTVDGYVYFLTLAAASNWDSNMLRIKCPFAKISQIYYCRKQSNSILLVVRNESRLVVAEISPECIPSFEKELEFPNLLDLRVTCNLQGSLLLCVYEGHWNTYSFDKADKSFDIPLIKSSRLMYSSIAVIRGIQCALFIEEDYLQIFQNFDSNPFYVSKAFKTSGLLSDIFVDIVGEIHLLSDKGYSNCQSLINSTQWTKPILEKSLCEFITAFDILQDFLCTDLSIRDTILFQHEDIQWIIFRQKLTSWQDLMNDLELIRPNVDVRFLQIIFVYWILSLQPWRLAAFVTNSSIDADIILESQVYLSMDQKDYHLVTGLLSNCDFPLVLHNVVCNVMSSNYMVAYWNCESSSFSYNLNTLLEEGLLRQALLLTRNADSTKWLEFSQFILNFEHSAEKSIYLDYQASEIFELVHEAENHPCFLTLKPFVVKLLRSRLLENELKIFSKKLDCKFDYLSFDSWVLKEIGMKAVKGAISNCSLIPRHFVRKLVVSKKSLVNNDLPDDEYNQMHQELQISSCTSHQNSLKYCPKLPSRLGTIVEISELSLPESTMDKSLSSHDNTNSSPLTVQGDLSNYLQPKCCEFVINYQDEILKTPSKNRIKSLVSSPVRHSPRLIEKLDYVAVLTESSQSQQLIGNEPIDNFDRHQSKPHVVIQRQDSEVSKQHYPLSPRKHPMQLREQTYSPQKHNHLLDGSLLNMNQTMETGLISEVGNVTIRRKKKRRGNRRKSLSKSSSSNQLEETSRDAENVSNSATIRKSPRKKSSNLSSPSTLNR